MTDHPDRRPEPRPEGRAEPNADQRRGQGLYAAGLALGLPYALLLAHWGAGGRILLGTYDPGSGSVGEHSAGDHVAGYQGRATLLLAAALLVALACGALALIPRTRRRVRATARWITWMCGTWLILAGLATTALGIGGLAHLDGLAGTAGPPAWRWHALLWDPWLLLCGTLLLAAVYRSSQAGRTSSAPPLPRLPLSASQPLTRLRLLLHNLTFWQTGRLHSPEWVVPPPP